MKAAKVILDVAVISLICLWAYAGTIKLLDFAKFSNQLNHSPVIGAIGSLVAIVLPIAELVLCALLLFDKTKRLGLILSVALLGIFTLYIVYILNFASNVPCSCGGVLQTLTWKQHIAFNLGFMLLGCSGLYLHRRLYPGRANPYSYYHLKTT